MEARRREEEAARRSMVPRGFLVPPLFIILSDRAIHRDFRFYFNQYPFSCDGELLEMFGQLMSESTAPPPRKRRRPALSCVQCRRRKIKCDRNDPCTQCTQSKGSNCTYKDGYPWPTTSEAHAAEGVASLAPFLSPESHDNLSSYRVASSVSPDRSAIDSNGRSQGSNSRTVPLFNGTHSNSTTLYSPSDGSPAEPQPEQNVQLLADRVSKLEQNLNTVSPGNLDPRWTSFSEIDNQTFFGQSARVTVPELRGSVSKTRLYGQSHWMTSFGYVSNYLSLLLYHIPMRSHSSRKSQTSGMKSASIDFSNALMR